MRLVERLNRETSAFHADVDEEVLRVGTSGADYRRYLMKTYGFIAPIERSISTTPDVERLLDLRRFKKEELLRRDLNALHITAAQIHGLAQCAVPLFNTAEEALGWAYFVERSTLKHNTIFVHFAASIPGDVAFASSFLKCYFGSVGDLWRGFCSSLDIVERDGEPHAQRVVDAALLAFRFYRRWHELDAPAKQESAPADAGSTSDDARPLTAD